jgi:uncharacterized lipoprotein YbaY
MAQAKKWRLGVTGDNTEIGVLVREVERNSPAFRARIETGDLIINVAGFQVGMVGGRLYDLAEEINRRADAVGYVTLVVQDHRTGRLDPVQVQLDDHQSVISGTLVYRERMPLPVDAIVTVQIDNLTRPYYSVKDGYTSFRPNGETNIPFEIAYDETYINTQDIYQIRAIVTSGGRTILETRQPQRVITQGNPSQVSLQLVAIGGANSNVGGGVISAGYPNFNEMDDRLIALYRRYLNRDPTAIELAALRLNPNISSRLDQVPLELMAAQEYFDAAGNNNTIWLERVFQEIVKRRPSASEAQQWMNRYASLGYSRMELLRQLYSQVNR